MYHIDACLPDIMVWDYGCTCLALKACRDIGLFSCLSQAFGARAMEIVAMASYIIQEGNIMDAIDDWQQRNCFPGFDRLPASQTSSRTFATITVPQQYEFLSNG
jgi:hypothetical protein